MERTTESEGGREANQRQVVRIPVSIRNKVKTHANVPGVGNISI
jgi:hypothetical protein